MGTPVPGNPQPGPPGLILTLLDRYQYVAAVSPVRRATTANAMLAHFMSSSLPRLGSSHCCDAKFADFRYGAACAGQCTVYPYIIECRRVQSRRAVGKPRYHEPAM